MSDETKLTCREIDELGAGDCCGLCHEATRTGHDRLRLVELDDGRMARVCHVAFDALREVGLLTTTERMDELGHSG